MRSIILSTAIALIALFSVNAAMAQNPHYTQGPSVSVFESTITFSGRIAGLGNNDGITIAVEGNSIATVDCKNPGGHIVSSQQETLTVSGSASFNSDQNGKVDFSLPITVSLETNPCPNTRWTPIISNLGDFHGTLTVSDASGPINDLDFTF